LLICSLGAGKSYAPKGKITGNLAGKRFEHPLDSWKISDYHIVARKYLRGFLAKA